MKKIFSDPDVLRTHAELKIDHGELYPKAMMRSAEDLLHELQVHRIELEMQNETLRQSQVALEESRDRYVDLYDFAPVGYLTFDEKGLISEVNLTGATLLGVERKKLLKRRFAQFVIPEDRDRFHRHFSKALVLGGKQSCELSLVRADGTVFYVHMDSLNIRQDGRSEVARIAFIDITERAHAEAKLRESEEKLQAIFENAVDGIVLADVKSMQFSLCNSAFGTMLGYSAEELTRMGVKDIHREQDLPLVLKDFESQATGASHKGADIPVKRKDGSVFYADINTAQLTLNGKPYLLGIFRDTTRRKLNDEALRISAQRYQLLFDSSRDALMTLAPPEWRFTSANASTLKLFGAVNVDEFTGLGPWAISPEKQPDGRLSIEKAQAMIATAMRDGSHQFEWVHQRLDGQVFPADVLLTRMELGEDVFLQATVRNISERKTREEELRRSEHKFSMLFHQASLPSMLSRAPDHKFIDINDAWANLFGYTKAELIGRTSVELGINRNAELRAQNVAEIGLHKAVREQEQILFTKTGEPRNVLVSINAIDIGGEDYAITSVQDITEIKRTELALKKNEERLLFALDTGHMGGWDLNLTDNTAHRTMGHHSIFGYESPHSDWSYEVFLSHVLAEDRAEVERLHREAIATLSDVNFECRIRRSDGEVRWIWVAGKHLPEGDRTSRRMTGIVQDITERKQMENELRESRQLLRDLAAKTELLREEERKHIAREVHDELGQILTALRMDVTLLNLRFGEQTPELVEKTEGMRELLDQAGRCVHDIVSDLRPTALDRGIVPAVHWLCSEFAARTGSSCVVHTNEEDIDLDEASAVAMFRIVQELLTNVARYAEASAVKINLARHGNDLHVAVSDNGKGFDPAAASKLKSFGLLGIRERINALGGNMKIVSKVNRGTEVSVVVPSRDKGASR